MIQARCAVCGTDLKDALRACARCDSIYHRDCWEYNGGCAIYGCRRVAARATKPGAVPASQRCAFGALLGTAAMCALFAVTRPGHIGVEALVYVCCATLLGCVSGRLLRHRRDTLRIALLGLIGPGLAFCSLMSPMVWLDPRAFFYTPLIVVFGMVASPLALPCAVVAARFNDPELASPRRQRLWLAVAAASALASAVWLASLA